MVRSVMLCVCLCVVTDAGQGPSGRWMSIGFGHRGQGLLHQGAIAHLPIWGFVADFSGGDNDALARAHHLANGVLMAALKRGQKIDFVFHGGDLALGRGHGEAGITSGHIGQGAHGTTVVAALLLGDSV